MKLQLLDVFGIGEAIWQLLYNICVRGPLFIVNGLGDAITYLSGPKIINLVFGSNGHFFNLPKEFIVFLFISFTLIIIFSCCVILQALIKQGAGGILTGLLNRVITIILMLIFVPLFFWIVNFTVVSIIQILMPQLIDGRALADMVGKLGFTDGIKHDGWHYDVGFPDWNNYNLFLGTFGSLFSLIIFFLMGLSLIKRLFDLFLLYVTSPIVFATAATNSKWQKVSIWKDLVIGRFISTLGIILTLTLFMNLEPIMMNAADQVSSNWVGQTAFKLLFIAGGAVASYSAQMLFSSLVGETVGIMDGLSMLFTAKAATAGIKAGTLGMLTVGKGLIMGKSKLLRNNDGSSPGIGAALKAGKIAKTTSFITKATVGSVLTSAGFIGGTISNLKTLGVKETLKRTGSQAIKPINKVGTIVKSKISDSYNAGKIKHVSTKNDGNKHQNKDIKKDIINNSQQNKIIKKKIKKGEL